MKKLLFGLLALSLSAATFAANPGDSSTANMTIQAQLTVLPTTNDLVIEEQTDAGAWDVVTGVSSFDHGTMFVGGTIVPKPVVPKVFRIRRGDDSLLKTDTQTPTPGNYSKANVTITNNTSDKIVNGTNTIDHKFTTDLPTDTLIGEAKEIQFTIDSKLASEIPSTTVAGVYTRNETVTVALSN